MEGVDFQIIRRPDGRFIISDPATKKVMDDAQGYGYKTSQSATKAAWYKFKGGKNKINSAKKEAALFWRNHKEFSKAVTDLLETWFKEIARGEIIVDTEVYKLAEEMSIEGFNPKFLEYLP